MCLCTSQHGRWQQGADSRPARSGCLWGSGPWSWAAWKQMWACGGSSSPCVRVPICGMGPRRIYLCPWLGPTTHPAVLSAGGSPSPAFHSPLAPRLLLVTSLAAMLLQEVGSASLHQVGVGSPPPPPGHQGRRRKGTKLA